MKRAYLVPLWVVVAACVQAHTQRLAPEVRPALAPDSVLLLSEAPDRPYRVIARVEVKTGAVFKSFDDLRAEIVERAAQLGGEAVIFGREIEETEFIILPTGPMPSEKRKLAGDVIVFD